MFKRLASGLLDLIYPPVCVLCRDPLSDPFKSFQVCPRCYGSIHLVRPPFCLGCGRPLDSSLSDTCKICSRHPVRFDHGWSACLYQDRLRELLHAFKYRQKTGLRHLFAHLIFKFLNRYNFHLDVFDCLCPIPLSRQQTGGRSAVLKGSRRLASPESRYPLRSG